MEQTFAMIKPDAFAAGHTGKIIDRILTEGYQIVGLKKLWLSAAQAGDFYYVHKERPFFDDLCQFMSSGPAIALVLAKENAVADWRALMGATNPAEADEGTLRKAFGTALNRNATHGSDAPETAAFEIGFFFSGLELRG